MIPEIKAGVYEYLNEQLTEQLINSSTDRWDDLLSPKRNETMFLHNLLNLAQNLNKKKQKQNNSHGLAKSIRIKYLSWFYDNDNNNKKFTYL